MKITTVTVVIVTIVPSLCVSTMLRALHIFFSLLWKKLLFSCPFRRWENWGLGTLSDWFKEHTYGKEVRIWIQFCLDPNRTQSLNVYTVLLSTRGSLLSHRYTLLQSHTLSSVAAHCFGPSPMLACTFCLSLGSPCSWPHSQRLEGASPISLSCTLHIGICLSFSIILIHSTHNIK